MGAPSPTSQSPKRTVASAGEVSSTLNPSSLGGVDRMKWKVGTGSRAQSLAGILCSSQFLGTHSRAPVQYPGWSLCPVPLACALLTWGVTPQSTEKGGSKTHWAFETRVRSQIPEHSASGGGGGRIFDPCSTAALWSGESWVQIPPLSISY